MKTKQVLGYAAIGVATIVGSSLLLNYGNLPELRYNGVIGQDYVVFKESPWSPKSVLRVEKPGGQTIEYRLLEKSGQQLFLEKVVTEFAGQVTTLGPNAPNADANPAVKQAMVEVRGYLNMILKAKKTQ